MKIGVLALQGDFAEHIAMLQSLDVEVVEVRLPQHLDGVKGLIIPGGESTTIGKLSDAYNLTVPLRDFASKNAVWGTCAGAIFLSKDVGRKQTLLGIMDITVERNAFGRQVDSFEIDLSVPVLTKYKDTPFHAVFIRAPLIESIGQGVEVVSSLPDGRVVAARQGHLLATSFHPELTSDNRFHRFFLELIR